MGPPASRVTKIGASTRPSSVGMAKYVPVASTAIEVGGAAFTTSLVIAPPPFATVKTPLAVGVIALTYTWVASTARALGDEKPLAKTSTAEHDPSVHVPAAHALPQAPQFIASLTRFVAQSPLQFAHPRSQT